jgi:hypothetical protein
MNFSSGTIASGHGYSKSIPKRCFRRGVGVPGSVLALVREDAPQREHDLPPWEALYQQTQRWIKAGVFEEMVHDLRVLLWLSEGRASEPSAAILDSRTLRSTPETHPLYVERGRKIGR